MALLLKRTPASAAAKWPPPAGSTNVCVSESANTIWARAAVRDEREYRVGVNVDIDDMVNTVEPGQGSRPLVRSGGGWRARAYGKVR